MSILKRILNRVKHQRRDNESELNRHISKAHSRLAAYLNHKAASWTMGQMKIWLFLFCFFAGGYSVFVAVHSIIHANAPPMRHKGSMPPPYMDTASKNNFQRLKNQSNDNNNK